MIVGFTGTQVGLTIFQKVSLEALVRALAPSAVHHGDCIGADADFDELAARLSIERTAHPGTDKHGRSPKRAHCRAQIVLEAKEYRKRNADIVDLADVLIGCPGRYVEESRSGTWATIRMARRKATPCYVVWPDGRLTIDQAA